MLKNKNILAAATDSGSIGPLNLSSAQEMWIFPVFCFFFYSCSYCRLEKCIFKSGSGGPRKKNTFLVPLL